jgi:uncharacterized membrane protein
MSNNQTESRLRSLIKGLTWRFIASAAIFLITYFTTGEVKTAAKVTSIEFPLKLALYYLHERIWLKVPKGLGNKVINK